MIKYIPIGPKVIMDEPCFAFYRQIPGRFVMYNNQQAWTEWKHFESDWRAEGFPKTPLEHYRNARRDYIEGLRCIKK